MRRRTTEEFGAVRRMMIVQFRAAGYTPGIAAMRAAKLIQLLDPETDQFVSNAEFIYRTERAEAA